MRATHPALRWLALLWIALSFAAHAIDPIEFRTPEEERRFKAIVRELRCLQCQNESIAESHATIARDLRRQVIEQLREGRSDAEIRGFMTDRYGEFVLYRPPMEPRNYVLWAAPVLLAVLGIGLLLMEMRKRKAATRAGATAPPPATGEDW